MNIKRLPFAITLFLSWGSFLFLAGQSPGVPDSAAFDAAIDAVFPLEQEAPERALELYDSLYRAGVNSEYYDGAIRSNLYAGIVHNDGGRFRQALNAYRKSIDLFRFDHSELLEAKVYNNAGVTHNLNGSKDSAATYFLKALTIAEAIRDTSFLILLHSNLGSVMIDLGETQAAMKYAEQAYKLSAYLGDSLTMGSSLLNLVNCKRKLGPYPQAGERYEEVLNIALESKSEYLEYLAYTAIADMHYQDSNFSKSLAYSAQALNAARRHENPYSIVHALQNYGLMNKELGNWELAHQHIDEAIELATETQAMDLLSKSLLFKSETFAIQGLGIDAYNMLSKRMALEDSLQNAGQRILVAELQSIHETEKKDLQIMQQAEAIESAEALQKFQYVIISLLILGLALAVILGLVYFKLSKQKAALQALNLQRVEQASVLRSIESKLQGVEEERKRLARELHDGIVGRLSILQARLKSGVPSNDLVADLGDANVEVRRIAHSMMPDIFMKYGFKHAVSAYVEQAKEYAIPIEFYYLGSDEVESNEATLHAYRMIQELLTNAIKHSKASFILVQVEVGEAQLRITVEDDGIGMPTEVLNGNTGLTALRERIKLVNGNLNIRSQAEKGTSIEIAIHMLEKAKT